MDAVTTSGENALAPADTLRGEWARFGVFLKWPKLPDRAPMPRLSSLVAVMRMLLLDFTFMAILLGIAGIAMAVGTDLPQTALSGMEMTPLIIFAAVVAAPLMEEIAFRGWLSGRPGHVLGWLLLAGAVVGVGVAGFAGGAPSGAAKTGMAFAGLGVLVAIIAAILAIVLLRKRDAMRWFQRIFPLFFWLSTLAFSIVHVFNFPPDQMVMALPLVLPQFATGMILGYLRVNYGLWASILLHFLHNAAFIGMVVLASGAGKAAG